ncbi:hypothetical protein A3Q56_06923 [Intoshia linei]|uniref:Endonuclease/exonuclease/phosphatase domain-containing protein n=1 Tax=Intoshia linei TaxID=1819745 RepID=A0A177AV21_9BILA|nr:hypothetical protein A3Q56_06923 [Intoshia linei]
MNNDQNITLISAYAPTLEVSKKHPEKREDLYDKLESVLKTVKTKDIIITGSHINTKTGSAFISFPDNMGRYGKGRVNENGYELLNFCQRNKLFLSNTKFKYKLAHVTWQSPENPTAKHYDGNIRKRHIRNQIDYVIFR